MAALSQSSLSGSYSSGHSLFTQISINRSTQCAPSAFSNEALCLEILSILRRCFMQQADVRMQLYEGLYEAVCLNSEIGIPVLEMMWMHFSDFYKMDEDALPPLCFDKITITKGITVILQEPLGKLIYTIGLIVTKLANDNENTTVLKFKKILESLCSRMINCELVHFELDDGTDLLDTLPESQQKLHILKEAMSVYEALIGYKIYSWVKGSEDNAKQISNLLQGYMRLLHFSKNLSKPKKAESKKKKDNNKTTQAVNTTTVVKKDAKSAKSPVRSDTILTFPVVIKIMNLLYEPMVTWATSADVNVLKPKRDFHNHMMQATLHLVTSLKNKKILDVQHAKTIYGYLTEIAILLYERVIKKLEDFVDFDCATAILAVECFLAILNEIIYHHKSNFQLFLSKVGGKEAEEELAVHLSEFVETYQKLFQIDETEISDDPEIKKLSLLVINTLSFLSNQIPTCSNTLALQMMDWLKDYTINKTITSKQVATSFVKLLLDSHLKFKVSLTFFEHIALRLGDVTGVIDEEEHNVEEFKIITDVTVNNVFVSLCNALKDVMEDIEWIVARLRAEYSMITHPGEASSEKKKEYLKSKERGVCCQLCFIVTIMTHLSNCTIPPGTLSESLLKNLILLYNTLGSLTKYFILRSSKINPVFQGARFESLVKLAGKQLAPVVYKLITYLEECQNPDSKGETQKKKKKNVDTTALKSKVLKETRMIPKVVYEIEQFSKFVIQLSNKTKIDLAKCVGQGTVRDFRILHLKEVLEKAPPVTQTTQESDTSTSLVENNEEQSAEIEENTDEGDSSPPAKKKKQ